MKKNFTLSLLLLSFITCNSYSQIVGVYGSTTISTGSASTKSVLVVGSGLDYSIGDFEGTIDINPEPAYVPLNSNGNKDVFIQKFVGGVFDWGKVIGGSGLDGAVSIIASGNDGGIYITGVFSGSVDFDPNIGIYSLTSNGGTDVFVMKLSDTGNLLWAKSFGGIMNDDVASMVQRADAYLYLTGTYQGTADLNLSSTVNNSYVSAGGKDTYIEKIDLNGNFIWAKSVGGLKDDVGMDISVQLDQVYVAGSFSGKADFDPSAQIYTLITGSTASPTNIAYFILKLNESGIFTYVKKLDNSTNTGINQSFDISLTSSGSDIYVTGEFNDQLDFDPNIGTQIYNSTLAYTNGFLLKLSSSGTFQWVRIFIAPSLEVSPLKIIIGPTDVYLTGTFIGTADFDNTTTNPNDQLSSNTYNTFVLCYDHQSGIFQWVRQYENNCGGISSALSAWQHGGYLHLLIGGRAEGTVQVDIYPGAIQLLRPSGGALTVCWIIDEFYNSPVINTGILEEINLLKSDATIYPNPTNNEVHLRSNEGLISDIIIRNDRGVKMDVKLIQEEQGWKFEMANLPFGEYNIEYKLLDKIFTSKIILYNK